MEWSMGIRKGAQGEIPLSAGIRSKKPEKIRLHHTMGGFM